MGRSHLRDDTSVSPGSGIAHRLALRAVPWAALTIVWIALWGDASPGTVLAGAGLSAAVVAVTGSGRREHLGRFRPLAALHLLAHVTWSLVKATTLVAWEVVTPTNRIREGIIALPLPSATPAVVTVVTLAIGVTPGTVVLEIDEDPCVLWVHVLHLRDIEAVRTELARMEALALRALGPGDAGPDVVRLESGEALVAERITSEEER